uniref:AB hydrolase-1 domain-containing protein n=1 Tax=Timema bartmani TaxID=61472 RepID=A0A7R9I7K3_9NEOP|nr:unnamed protein product [Timema bartmani]
MCGWGTPEETHIPGGMSGYLQTTPNSGITTQAVGVHNWHHMGVFDLPAEIDYILQNTQQQSLYYAGHSMGTTKFFVMASKRPEYNLKIRTMFALAPIVFMSHMQSPFKKLAFAGETLFSTQWHVCCVLVPVVQQLVQHPQDPVSADCVVVLHLHAVLVPFD